MLLPPVIFGKVGVQSPAVPPATGSYWFSLIYLFTVKTEYFWDGVLQRTELLEYNGSFADGNTGNSTCPANSTGTPANNPSTCTCNSNYKPDATATTCVPVAVCPIDPLPELPQSDACAQSLEKGLGTDVNKACPDLTPEMQKQADCLAAKIHALGLAYTGPSATIRNAEYQKHLRAVWDKSIEIKKKVHTEEQKQACVAIIADVKAHMDRHKIKYRPSAKADEAPHVQGNAVDISVDVVNAMQERVSNTTFVTFTNCSICMPIAITTVSDVQDYVNSSTVNPPACNLEWGGEFTPTDPVHFQLP